MNKMIKAFKRNKKRNSEKWCQIFNIGDAISDPDGWDRSNFEFSFNKEKITKTEFRKRLLQSTLKITPETHNNMMLLDRIINNED